MATRKIVRIDEEKCNGCGLCIPNCAEGALQIVDGKAKLMSEKFCDGRESVISDCPEDAITVIERDAEEFDEKAVEIHLHKHNEAQPKPQPVFTGCPSSRAMHFKVAEAKPNLLLDTRCLSARSLACPVEIGTDQRSLFSGCRPSDSRGLRSICLSGFHRDFMKGKAVVVGCPKLDDIEYYKEKLTEIFKTNSIKSITLPHMEVPCCFGLVKATEDAIAASGKNIPLKKVKIGIRGDIKPEDNGSNSTPSHVRHPH